MQTLRFEATHETLRQRFIGHDEVVGALMLALEWTARSVNKNLFPLVIDTLCSLICDNDLRGNVISRLSAPSNPTGPLTTRLSVALEVKHILAFLVVAVMVVAEWTGKFLVIVVILCYLVNASTRQLGATSNATRAAKSRFSVALEVKSPNQLAASLKMIASLAQIEPGPCKALRPKIHRLAKTRRSLVGSVAVEALVALKEPLTRGIHISNILGYLSNTLPPLDVEGGDVSSTDGIGELPFVLRVNGSGPLDADVMCRLVLAIRSRNARERTAATLTLLKLCGNSLIREACLHHKVLDMFMLQLEQKKTSLLAAYALWTCLKHNMWTPADFRRGAQRIVAMLDKGWFDDAVGRVEGCEILRGLMTFAELREQVNGFHVIETLVKKLEAGERHQVRMSSICLDVLGEHDSLELGQMVAENVSRLKDKHEKVQREGVKVLTALARTSAGERAIEPHMTDIMKMLLPPLGGPPLSRSQLLGPAAAVYGLCKNENLRKKIEKLPAYKEWRKTRTT